MLDPAWDDDDDNVQKFSPIIQQPFIIPEAVAAKWRSGQSSSHFSLVVDLLAVTVF